MITLFILLLAFLTPAVADATTFYVSKSTANGYAVGNNGNACTLTSAPCLTIAGGLGKMSAGGHTLIINDGTYVETLDNVVPSGGGTDATRTIVKCLNARACTLDPAGFGFNFLNATTNWITIQDMVICCSATVLVRMHQSTPAPYTNMPHHMRFVNNEIHTGSIYLIYTGHGCCNEWINNYIHDCGEQCVYLLETESVWRGNELYRALNGQQFFTMHVSGGVGSANDVFEDNYLHTCVTGAPGTSVGFEIANTNGHILRRNVIAGCQTAGIRTSVGISNNITLDQNVVYGTGSGTGIHMTGGTGSLIRNNIVNNFSTNINVCGGCGTQTTNRTIGTATDIWTDPAGGNFTLKAGSAAIDSGTNISGAFNGSAPDQGAFETVVFATCSVEAGDASTLRVTFTNNVQPPLLPATAITGFTARKAGSNDVITAAVRTGDTRVDLTLTDAIVAGNAVDISYSGGNLTDSALVGNSRNQPYLATLSQQSCTNNVGGAPAAVLTQTYARFHGLRGTEAAPVVKPHAAAAVNTNITSIPGGKFRVRLKVACTVDNCPAFGMTLRYSKNGGAYTVVPDSFDADNLRFVGTSVEQDVPSDGTATTELLTSDHASHVACAVIRTANAVPTVDLAQNSETECEYAVQLDSDATPGDTYDFRLYDQGGAALSAYSVTPRVTVVALSAAGGF